MRNRFLSQALCLALIATLGLTGCKNFRWPWQKKPPATTENPGPIGLNTGIPGEQRPIITDANLDHSQFVADIVYFDLDSAKVKPGNVSKIRMVADWMKSNPGKKLVVEGYCDERGTAEYNRALGERRAQAAREELVHMGVDPSRISTSSYGSDRPADPGHDEAAWSKNRRCEFAIVK